MIMAINAIASFPRLSRVMTDVSLMACSRHPVTVVLPESAILNIMVVPTVNKFYVPAGLLLYLWLNSSIR